MQGNIPSDNATRVHADNKTEKSKPEAMLIFCHGLRQSPGQDAHMQGNNPSDNAMSYVPITIRAVKALCYAQSSAMVYIRAQGKATRMQE